MVEKEVVLGLAAEIVSAHVRNNAVPTDQLPTLIQQVFNTLVTAEQKSSHRRPEPAVPINRSMRADYLTCLDCGKHLSMLKRHLRMDHQLTPQQYRQRWGLPVWYPWLHLATPRCDQHSEEDRAGANWPGENARRAEEK